jgi:hypothetical protein
MKLESLSLAYGEAIERINSQMQGFRNLAMKVLSWITCAKRPLTICELQHALGTKARTSKLDDGDFPQTEDMVSVCAGLVTIDKESRIIRLVHYTTQEYFERTQRQWFPNAETDITTICVTYLSFNKFESGICKDEDEFNKRLQSNKLYDYAAHYWGHHAREALTSCPSVLKFLQKQGQVEGSIQALMAVKQWPKYSQQIPKEMTGLHLAAYFGVHNAVTALLGSNGPDSKDSYSRTPLSHAAESGHEAVVTLLLANGAELDLKDLNDRTPLSYAAARGHEAVVTLLLAKGAELETKDACDGRTPLSWAAGSGHEAVVKLLLAKQADVDSKGKDGQTPLSYAARSGHEAIIKLLLEQGAEIIN